MAPGLLTQSGLHFDPSAGGRALAYGEPNKSIESKTSPLAAAVRRLIVSSSLLTHLGDDFVDHRSPALERFAPHMLIGLMRLIEVTRPANQRYDPRAGKPSTVGAIECAAACLLTGNF